MQNQLVQLFTSATLLLTVPISPAVMVPSLEPSQLKTHGDMVIGKPDEKLLYLLSQCSTNEDVEKLAKSFDAVAKLYEEQLDHRNAEVCYLIAIRLMHSCLPKNSITLADEYERLAAHYSLVDQGELARIANLRALQIYRANGAEYAIELAVLEHNQAWLELYAGKNGSAEHYMKHCLKLLRSTLGENHVLVGLISSSLGELYMFNGNFVAAEKLLRTALKILPQYADMEEVMHYVQGNYSLAVERIGRKSGEKVVRGEIK